MVERISEIYSLLVPLLDGRLIIPRSCVAEVVGFQQPSEMPGAPPRSAFAGGELNERVWKWLSAFRKSTAC